MKKTIFTIIAMPVVLTLFFMMLPKSPQSSGAEYDLVGDWSTSNQSSYLHLAKNGRGKVVAKDGSESNNIELNFCWKTERNDTFHYTHPGPDDGPVWESTPYRMSDSSHVHFDNQVRGFATDLVRISSGAHK